MDILFMGTGAADWDITSRKDGDFFRRRTSVMINNDLLIDFNDETLDYIEKNECSLQNVENILITHTHDDHYSQKAVNKMFGKNTEIRYNAGAKETIGSTNAVQRHHSDVYKNTSREIQRYCNSRKPLGRKRRRAAASLYNFGRRKNRFLGL